MFEKYKKILVSVAGVIVLTAVAFGAGYWAKKPVTITKIETVEKIVKVKDNSTSTTTIVKPDGTTETTVVQNDISTDTSTSTTVKPGILASYQPKYSLGFQAQAEIYDLLKQPTYMLTAGYRFLGNMWAEGSYNINKKDIGLGLRVEF
jgi:hypothetical protein